MLKNVCQEMFCCVSECPVLLKTYIDITNFNRVIDLRENIKISPKISFLRKKRLGLRVNIF